MENKAPKRIKYKGQIYEAVESSNKGDFKVTFGQMDDELDHYINDDEDFDVFVSLDEIKQEIGEKSLRQLLKGWTQEEADDLIEEFSEFKLVIKKIAYKKIPSYIPKRKNGYVVKNIEILNYDIFPSGIEELSKKLGRILLPRK